MYVIPYRLSYACVLADDTSLEFSLFSNKITLRNVKL